MNILVTDGENRSTLALTRSLAKNGARIFVASNNSNSISSVSKFCFKNYVVPNPLLYSAKYSSALVDILNKDQIDIVFPMSEQSIYSINQSRELFPAKVILACPTTDKMEAVSNKYKLFKNAEKLGVAIPETTYISGRNDFYAKKDKIVKFPVVIKPALSKRHNGEKVISAGVKYAVNKNDLISLYESLPELNYPSLIQEKIIGQGTGLFTLFDRDRHLALFSHRRLLEKPPSGGVSVISESIALDTEMVKIAQRLLAAAKWEGVAMVEFKRDERDGKAKLMEINGRFWGSLQLAVSSGVNFPSLALDYHLHKKPRSLSAEYSVGHRLKWFYGILDHLIIRMKFYEKSSQKTSNFPTRWQVVKELTKSGDANTFYDVFDREDLLPFLSETKAYMLNILRFK